MIPLVLVNFHHSSKLSEEELMARYQGMDRKAKADRVKYELVALAYGYFKLAADSASEEQRAYLQTSLNLCQEWTDEANMTFPEIVVDRWRLISAICTSQINLKISLEESVYLGLEAIGRALQIRHYVEGLWQKFLFLQELERMGKPMQEPSIDVLFSYLELCPPNVVLGHAEAFFRQGEREKSKRTFEVLPKQVRLRHPY